MKKVFLAIISMAGMCMVGSGSSNYAAQCWLYVSGMCWFAYGMIRFDAVFKEEKA